ncbi:hypothetical protein BDP27DRAFT_1228131 [Rhodocollybia butyracea]|uniref:Uncharacterized protein n=1 Tax=Rhodocollybia butyracea TaxID=206335 RepID=A0A9P5PMI5_9AGAR|nr:hypothetical protein BDP27DRAFT_1228131 [Rhodocollybia butyracea]
MANPYAVWNVQATKMGRTTSEPLPSIYGALPFPLPVEDRPSMVFTFTGFDPTVTNCTILGPNGSPQFRIVTDSSMPGYTLLKTLDGRRSALIEWRNQAKCKVEIRGMVSKQYVSEFLRVSPDKRYRIMLVRSQEFMWLPEGDNISLYTVGSSQNNSEFLGRISRNVGAVTLELTQSAVRGGLLQASIIATVLIQSGLNID